MDLLPIELVENILKFSDGNSFTRCSRVCHKWLDAKINIERTCDDFWKTCCDLEIEKSIFDDLNDCRNEPIAHLTEDKCKAIYIKWFRTRRICDWIRNSFDFTGNLFAGYENVRALKVTGTLIISGHRSGRVLIIDYKNDVIIPSATHLEPITDLALINLVGNDYYEIHKNANYPTTHPSYSFHHHIVSISKDSTIKIFPIRNTSENPRSIFEINSVHRTFLNVCVCNHIIAVSAKESKDIGLFRLTLPQEGVVPFDQPFKVDLIKNVLCRDICPQASNWFGVFTFSDLKIKVFCHESNRIACSDVALNLKHDIHNVKWKWHSIKELQYLGDEQAITLLDCFAFGHGIFFIITTSNRVYYTTDSKTFRPMSIHERLCTYDRIRTISLFGSAIAYGTDKGFLFIENVPSLERLSYITHYKPLFSEKICNKPIVKISINDDGMSPVVAAATKENILIFKWNPNENQKIRGQNHETVDFVQEVVHLNISDEE